MKTSEKAISTRLPGLLQHGVSTPEASKGVLNGERRVTRYVKQIGRQIFKPPSFLSKLPRSLNIPHVSNNTSCQYAMWAWQGGVAEGSVVPRRSTH